MAEKEMKYTVMVDENSHFSEESGRYRLGDFETCEEAADACKRIVDEFLLSAYKPGKTFEELWKGYTAYGEDPFIETCDEACKFSAWDYAKKRCMELAGNKEWACGR